MVGRSRLIPGLAVGKDGGEPQGNALVFSACSRRCLADMSEGGGKPPPTQFHVSSYLRKHALRIISNV